MFHALQTPSEAGYGAAAFDLPWREVGSLQPSYPAGSFDEPSLPQAPGFSGAPCRFSASATFVQASPAYCPVAAERDGFAQQLHEAPTTSGADHAAPLAPPGPDSPSLEDLLAGAALEQTAEPQKCSQRRKRTVYSPEQLAVLEAAFGQNARPGILQREKLAGLTGIPEDRLQVWFQNRRARYRKVRKACSSPKSDLLGGNSHTNNGTPMDRQATHPVVWQQQYFVPPLAPAGSSCTPRAPYSVCGPSPDGEWPAGEHRPLQLHYTVSGPAYVKETQSVATQ